jgi:hypothetical protein
MKKTTPILLTTAVFGLIATFFSTTSSAQVSANPDEGYTNNERDAMTGDFGGGGFNPMQLIHDAKFRNNRTMQEFYNDQNRNLDAARNNFFQQRQEMFRNYQPDMVNPSPTETEAQVESEVPTE